MGQGIQLLCCSGKRVVLPFVQGCVSFFSGEGFNRMPAVKVREAEPFENALRRFKKQCEKAGVLSEVRKREYYEKPSVKRKRKIIAARKKAAKARMLLGI